MDIKRWTAAAAIAGLIGVVPGISRAGEAMMGADAHDESALIEGKDVASGPLNRLLKDKKLDLTADQVTKITAIQADLKTKNQPLKDKIQATPGAPASRNKEDIKKMSKAEKMKAADEAKAWRKAHPELDPVFQEMKTNRKAAWDQALAVLTPDQQAVVKQKVDDMKKKSGDVNKANKAKTRHLAARSRAEAAMAEDPPVEVLETEPVPPADAAARAPGRTLDEFAGRKGRVRVAWMIAVAADVGFRSFFSPLPGRRCDAAQQCARHRRRVLDDRAPRLALCVPAHVHRRSHPRRRP